MFKRRYRAYANKYKPLAKCLNKLYSRDRRKVDIIPINQTFLVL